MGEPQCDRVGSSRLRRSRLPRFARLGRQQQTEPGHSQPKARMAPAAVSGRSSSTASIDCCTSVTGQSILDCWLLPANDSLRQGCQAASDRGCAKTRAPTNHAQGQRARSPRDRLSRRRPGSEKTPEIAQRPSLHTASTQSRRSGRRLNEVMGCPGTQPPDPCAYARTWQLKGIE